MSTQDRRLRERRLRAEQIEQATHKVFLEKGYDAATIQGIAREAELSVGAIYFYFKTKEEIFGSINLKFVEECDRGLEQIQQAADLTPEDKLRRAWELLRTVFCRSSLSLRALVHGQLQGSLQNISTPLLEKLNQTGRSVLGRLADVFREGVDRGVFRPANPLALADLFWGAFTGVVAWEEAKRTTSPDKKFMDATLDLALETLIQGRLA